MGRSYEGHETPGHMLDPVDKSDMFTLPIPESPHVSYQDSITPTNRKLPILSGHIECVSNPKRIGRDPLEFTLCVDGNIYWRKDSSIVENNFEPVRADDYKPKKDEEVLFLDDVHADHQDFFARLAAQQNIKLKLPLKIKEPKLPPQVQ